MKLSENAERVLSTRYYTRNEKGEIIEDWKGLCQRVCNAVGASEGPESADKWSKIFFEMMYNLDFLPNSPTLFNAGKDKGMLSACFVLDIEDSMSSIMKTLTDAATVFKCISGNQKMFIGNTVKLVKNVAIGDEVYVSNGTSHRIIDKIVSGKKDIYRLTTESGYTIECSKDHKVLALKNLSPRLDTLKSTKSCFEEVQNLTNKNAVQISIPNIFNVHYQKIDFVQEVSTNERNGQFKIKPVCLPKVMDERFAWLLGFFVGDGSYHRDGIRFAIDSISYPELIESLQDWCKSINSNFTISNVYKHSNVIEFSILRKNLKLLLQSLIGKNKLTVPNIIWASPKTVKESFLRGLFDADGTVLQGGYTSYCTCDSEFAKQIQDLLLSVGVYSKLYHRENGFRGHNIVYIRSKESHDLFVKNINSTTVFKSHRLAQQKPKWRNGNFISFEGKRWDIIKKIEKIGQEETFNFTVDEIHEYNSMGIISKNSGGGVGINFSDLRPEGSFIKSTGGTSSGPLSFMRMFDTMTEVVKQGGKRRGALMGMLNIEHPDIEKFIEAKIQEGILSNFNISVAVTDDFMRRVKEKEDKALKLWLKIIDGAWKNGEPGIVFLDTINEHNPVPHLGKIKCSNPCLTGDTMINTSVGWRRIDSLVGIKPMLKSDPVTSYGELYNCASKVWKSGHKEVYKVSTIQGFSVNATSNHKFLTTDGWKEVSELTLGDRLYIQSTDNRTIEEQFGQSFSDGWLSGSLVGDGCVSHGAVTLDYYEETELNFALRMFDNKYKTGVTRESLPREGTRLRNPEFARMILDMGITNPKEKKRTDFLFGKVSTEFIRGYLSGLFTADGSVFGESVGSGVTINLTQVDLDFLRKVQLLLLNLGIYSKVYEESRPAGKRILPDTDRKPKLYDCKASHVLCIGGLKNLKIFSRLIGFGGKKQDKLQRLIGDYTKTEYNRECVATVSKIEYIGKQDVYDITEPNTHAFIANGFISHNCAEYFFVPYGSCNLGSINLSNMLKEGSVDWDKYEKTIRQATRFLDNIISINHYPIPEIKDVTHRTRPIGLGIMGFADLLLKMGVRYDSAEGIDMAQEVMSFLQKISWDESAKLGKEKGSFPEFKKTKFAKQYEHLRNCQLTVIAPTGTLSMLAGCSSGIEPNFSWHTQMHRMDVVMEDFHPIAQKFLKNKEKLPFYFVTASEISPEWHIRMQAAFQVYTDNAISKTVNAPNHATKSDVHKAYMLGWELKCKGMTYYREGSRNVEVLVKGTDKEVSKHKKVISSFYRERTDELEGITRKIKTDYGNSYITVNFDEEGYPLEVFNQASAKIPCDASAEGLARMTSLALRHGIGLQDIIKQLKSARCAVGCVSCPDLMGDVLGDIVKKREESKKENECPECKSQLETSEGCLMCKSCGWGKCSV